MLNTEKNIYKCIKREHNMHIKSKSYQFKFLRKLVLQQHALLVCPPVQVA